MKTKVNVGCGPWNFGEDWWHVDSEKYSHIDSRDCYLTEIENNSLDIIYSSHFLEYFDKGESLSILKTWCSKLKEGGKIYVAVPDFKAIAHNYLENGIPLNSFLGPIYGFMQSDGKEIHHKTLWDYHSLSEYLKLAGFKRVKRFYTHEFWDEFENNDFKDFGVDCSGAKIDEYNISLNLVAQK